LVYVKNLGYHKNIEIVYTTDNGATWNTASASYKTTFVNNPDKTDELWSAEFDVPAGTTEVEYAVKYEVNGQTYWDNNFGENYKTN